MKRTEPANFKGCYRVMFLSAAGGAAEPQGYFRDREEAVRWAGKRKAWFVWEPIFPGERIKWTVKEKAPKAQKGKTA